MPVNSVLSVEILVRARAGQVVLHAGRERVDQGENEQSSEHRRQEM
jgi:hypothetical protein